MYNLKYLISQALLGMALLGGAGMASAGATYHVDIDTTGFAAGGTGYLDLNFASFGTADPLTATVTHLQGGFLGNPDTANVGIGANGALTFTSALASDYFQQILLGRGISFDISFEGMPSEGASAGFTADLLNGDQTDYLARAVAFALQPGAAPTYETVAGVATVQAASTAVPEPSILLSMATGIGMLGLLLRRRVR
jgi:hypothetical protein